MSLSIPPLSLISPPIPLHPHFLPPAQTLQASSSLFDSLTEVSSKHSKYLQKEYESLNEACGKFFKKIAKEEKSHDEQLETLDSKIKRAHASHEKSVRSKSNVGSKAMETHDKYLSTITNLTNEMNRLKSSHSMSTGSKNHAINLLTASTVGGLAESNYKKQCESVRKMGGQIGKLNEWLNFCSVCCSNSNETMPDGQPVFLDENEFGMASKLVALQAQALDLAQGNALKQAELISREQYNEGLLMNRREEELKQIEMQIKAKEMGWLPPPQQQASEMNSVSPSSGTTPPPPSNAASQQNSVTFSDLPKLDSSGQEISRSANVSKDTSAASNSPPSSSSQPTSNNTSNNNSTSTTFSNLSKSTRGTNNTNATSTASFGGSGEGSTSLNRAPTNGTLQSMKVEAQSWEKEESVADGGMSERAGSPSNSAHEGTVVDRGEESEENLDSQEIDGNEYSISKDRGIGNEGKGILQNPSNSKNLTSNDTNRTLTSSPLPHEPLSLSFDSTPLMTKEVEKFEKPLERKRTTSLWEREREREKTLEKERELSRKLGGYSNDLIEDGERKRLNNYSRESTPRASVGYSNSNVGDSENPGGILDRQRGQPIRFNLDPENRAGVGVASGGSGGFNPNFNSRTYQQEILPQGQQGQSSERYAPSVGKSKLNSGAVSRSLSTDTTSSERSFVARMKAKYQEEKDRDRERELGERERERELNGRRVEEPPSYGYGYDRDRRVVSFRNGV